MSTDPFGTLRDALGKAMTEAHTAARSKKRTPSGAASLDEAVAHHYTPTKKKDHHDD